MASAVLMSEPETSAGNLEIAPLSAADRAAWDAYVEAHPEGTFFHRSGWMDAIEQGFGHRCHHLLARRDGRIVGVLPLGEIRSRLFGHSLISTPFCVYGGPVADDRTVEDALIESACDLAERLGVDYLELRNRRPMRPDWPRKDLYVTFRRRIEADDEANMKAIPRKQRAMVRKGIKAGLRSEVDADTDRLFEAYSESVRNLGTPVFPKRWFETLRQVFGDDCEILTVTREGRTLASVMSFRFRDEILPYYGGGTAEARDCKGNDFMYWEVMRRAAAQGLRWFDYGRSKRDTGSFSFKKNWGFDPEPLYYEYYLVKAGALPDVSPKNPKYRYFIALWQRLPLWLSRRLGPLLARSLG